MRFPHTMSQKSALSPLSGNAWKTMAIAARTKTNTTVAAPSSVIIAMVPRDIQLSNP
ncbi:hypothetical protein [Microbacterium sp. CJ88]|uniref:hypothetical protein n=1 Tax=Microbacterium sp. CJ88 TaxID=3445672 RepID=UPI003F65E0E7